ncbi:hypothetical protein TNCV_422291 [Trichonephila clavipes]|nr:hypothetical protein TNCV_422291 [Trichonephila clavipes]
MINITLRAENGRVDRVTLSHHTNTRSAVYVDNITQLISTCASVKHCGVFSSDIMPKTNGHEKTNTGFRLGAEPRV